MTLSKKAKTFGETLLSTPGITLEQVKAQMLDYLESNYKTLGSKWTVFYDLRRMFLERFTDEKIIENIKNNIKPPTSWDLTLKKMATENAMQKEPVRVDMKEFEDLIAKNPETLKKYDLLTWLLAITGCRMVDLMESEFELKEGSLWYFPAKQRFKVLKQIEIILTDIPAQQIYDYIMDLRVQFQGVNYASIRRTLSNIMKKEYTTLLSGSSFRAVYNNYILDKMNITNPTQRVIQTTKNLRHKDDGLPAAMHYLNTEKIAPVEPTTNKKAGSYIPKTMRPKKRKLEEPVVETEYVDPSERVIFKRRKK